MDPSSSSSRPTVSNPSRQNTGAPARSIYRCNCSKYCKGVQQEVTRRKYELHAPFRVRPQDVLTDFVPVATLPGLPPAARSAAARARHAGITAMEADAEMPDLMDPMHSDEEMDDDEDNEDDDDDDDNDNDNDDDVAVVGSSLPRSSPFDDILEGDTDAGPATGDGSVPQVDPEYGSSEDVGAPQRVHRKEFRDTNAFIRCLQTATLENSGMSPQSVARVRTPRTAPVEITPSERLGVRMFTARGDASEENYADNRAAFMEFEPEASIPTYEQVKGLVANITGVQAIRSEMCTNTCVAYVGPFAAFQECPFCGEARYDSAGLARGKHIARRTFCTYPLGPQLQAMWGSAENALLMKHRAQETRHILAQAKEHPHASPVLDDVYYGQAYLEAVQDDTRPLGDDDMTLMFSLDGAQLYESKSSDCWFYVWVLFDLPPTLRYKKRYVLPGAVIGGPRKPKNVDSFIFPGLYHLAALQREGLTVWDAAEDRLFQSHLFLLLVTADGPAMAYLNGLVGHQGAHGCRLYCDFPGRNKPGMAMYYPAALCPHPPGPADHPDQSLRTIPTSAVGSLSTHRTRYEANLALVASSRTNAAYARNRLLTGIAKPSIFSGLPRILGVPDSFGADLMHLLCLNLTELIMGLLRGTLTCEVPDDRATWDWAIFSDRETWQAHGRLVAEATKYLPGSFDRPPRNPAEKISSGYKAWEFLLYVYGLLPGLLRAVQAPIYYRHFCKLVSAVRVILQRRLEPAQLPGAHRNFVEYAEGLESLYYQRRIERLHFVRQSVHATTHIVPEIFRLGPGTLYTQWTLENYIGSITREIKQHATPYANVSERALRRCQVNALKALIPSLAPEEPLPRGAHTLASGYVLLRALDSRQRDVSLPEATALHRYLHKLGQQVASSWNPSVQRWARLRLPNGQIAWTAWKECALESRGRAVRRARMIKLAGAQSRFGEVQYFFLMDVCGHTRALAMVAPFSSPDLAVLSESENTLWACTYPGLDEREVVECSDIVSVVAMVPLPLTPAERQHASEENESRFFVVEKPGLDVAVLAGRNDEEDNEDDLYT
ncbi:hypothetical protein BN946_scf184970.g50 [Trametes cinnabarina]|uniref:Uncharacterized protein n=1 Tax=Pycnoporus cinnabarinus TaxID=5643 RepID=A0A060SIE2_PYCCI|nr:hypothetical protein BN946_scf184970.g50 [Trametes cinnabarina]